MKKVPKIIIIITIILLLLFLFYLIYTVNEHISHTPMEFTPEKWDQHIWQRERMIDSLNSKFDLGSMKYDQIIELLGTNGISEDSRRDEMRYFTGKAEYFGKVEISQPFLEIKFDEHGNVDSTVILSEDQETSFFTWIISKLAALIT